MSKFALCKNFESAKANAPGSKTTFELLKTHEDEYTLLEHVGDHVGEIYSFTKSELRAIWEMLASKE